MLKENVRPSHQGQLFKINLYHNSMDGPFLKKDIMQSNKRSLALLTSKGILESIDHYNSSMTLIQTKTREPTFLFPENIDSVIKNYEKCQINLKLLHIESSKLAKQTKSLKNQLQIIYDREKQNQQKLYYECMPLLKGLRKTVKECRNKQKDECHLMERILLEISATKRVLVQGMIDCEARIIRLEEAIGCRTSDMPNPDQKDQKGV